MKFVFIIPETPKKYQTNLRNKLREVSYKSLVEQSITNWTALIIGESSYQTGNLKYLKCNEISKKKKLHYGLQYILANNETPEYIIRFDDDDIISPVILEQISELNGYDCFADKYQVHYDLLTGKTSFNRFKWMANTVIHKFEHAISTDNEFNTPLILCDHDKAFHKYYQNKNVWYSQKKKPLYIRILSPTCLSIKNINKSIISIEEKIDYTQFINSFGFWMLPAKSSFLSYFIELRAIAFSHFNVKFATNFLIMHNLYNYIKYVIVKTMVKLCNIRKKLV